MKRALISLLVGAGLMIAPAATFAASAPLAPGGAAGVHKAEMLGGMPVYALVGGVLVVVGIIAVTSGNGNGHVGTTTTCGSPSNPTATCGSSGTSSTGTN